MFDKLFVLSQYLTPQLAVSRLAGKLADHDRSPAMKNRVIRWFLQRYGVDMSEALEQDPSAYASFNEFFTRELQPGARPVVADQQVMTSPVDGAISQLGRIDGNRVFQAKGQHFSLLELLGGDSERAARAMGERLGIENIYAEVLPDQKQETVTRAQDGGRIVGMVGDGMNDAPALAGDLTAAVDEGASVTLTTTDLSFTDPDDGALPPSSGPVRVAPSLTKLASVNLIVRPRRSTLRAGALQSRRTTAIVRPSRSSTFCRTRLASASSLAS